MSDLLPSKTAGRLAHVTEDGPCIVPLNYMSTADAIVIQTPAYGEVARSTLDRLVAFEIDDLDDCQLCGWSVLDFGQATSLTEQQYRQLHSSRLPESWAGGPRTLFLRIALTTVVGRRILPG